MNSANFHDFDVQLYRESLSRPWGFRLQGGADFNFPLTVQRVFSGSPSELKLLRGDIILALDSYDVGRLTHKQAQDVVRVAGAGLTLRVRRPGAKSLHSMAASPPTRRPHSTTPRNDPATAYFAANQPPKPTWQPPPPASQNPSSSIGNFGVQYGPKKTTPAQYRPVAARSYSPQIRTQSPHEEEEALKRVEDSLQKLTMNHNMATEEDQEVDYSFTKKSVSERRKLFQDNQPQNETRLRSTSCQPTFRAMNFGSQYSPPTPYMTASYTEPSRTIPTPHRSTTTANVMSSSYTEGTRSKPSPSWKKPTGGFNFGWSPSPEKLAAARLAPHVSSVSQVQHSVVRSREASREGSPVQDSWMGAPLIRSTSVSVLQESPTRATIRYQDNAAPWNGQFYKLGRGQMREVGRWSMSSHFNQTPSTPSWTVHQASAAPWCQPTTSTSTKKFSTSATIRVGQSGGQHTPVRTVRRFSTSSTPMDGTMSLDRRHHEPLKISIGTDYTPDYHPAYPANVYHPVERSWSKPAQKAPQRSASQRGPARQTVKAEVGTYRPLQQSYSTPARPQSAMDPDYMSSDF